MKVFRFENCKGNGPITSLPFPWSMFKEHRGPRSFPEYKRWVSEKKSWKGIREEGYFFGMTSRELLLNMLLDEAYIFDIQELGFSIVEYQATDYLVFSDGQVMFKKE